LHGIVFACTFVASNQNNPNDKNRPPMKVNIILINIIALFSFITLNAQDYKIKTGDIQANIGVGLVPTYVADATTTIVPPISVSVEAFLGKNFSLGVYGAVSKYTGSTIYLNAGLTESFENTTLMLGIRPTIHSNDLDGWRVYGGFVAGASLPSIKKNVVLADTEVEKVEDTPSFSRPAENNLLFSGFVGTRKTLNANTSIFGELGFGISLVNVGVSYKF
jgi:hypothetical protein